MSIGIKVFCSNKNDYDSFCKSLNTKYDFEYFTYASKTEKPYNALLFIKKDIIDKGLKCVDVKIVSRVKENRGEQVIFQ